MRERPITAWDRKNCNSCGRERVHYKRDGKWYCIGILAATEGMVAECGQPVLNGVSSESM